MKCNPLRGWNPTASNIHCSENHFRLGSNFWVREYPWVGKTLLPPLCISLWPFWYLPQPIVITSFGLNPAFKDHRHGKLSESCVGSFVLPFTCSGTTIRTALLSLFSQLIIVHLYWGLIICQLLFWALIVYCQARVISSNPHYNQWMRI